MEEDIQIVLDSFAGSGTTAHAVHAQNKADGGNRRFILIECEDYADTVTAERVRRVIKGVPNAKDPALREGLGGSFLFCTLGDPIEPEAMLRGSLPDYVDLASYLLFTAKGISISPTRLEPDGELFYADDDMGYYMMYKPDMDYLRRAAMKRGQLTYCSTECYRGKNAVASHGSTTAVSG